MSWTTPKSWATNEVVTSTSLNTHLRDNLSGVLPIGTLILRVAAYSDQEVAVESRWLQCNGYAVSRTTYADLFAYFNSMSPALPFGVGDGVTTFNLPDLRGRGAYAEGEHADVDSMGDSDGAAIASRTPSHYHVTNVAGSNETGYSQYVTWQALTGTAHNINSTGSGVQDKPAYLVVGSYFVKFTN